MLFHVHKLHMPINSFNSLQLVFELINGKLFIKMKPLNPRLYLIKKNKKNQFYLTLF
jgi:hypothetical protein